MNEVQLLKNELNDGIVFRLNKYLVFILLNIYLFFPNTFINKLYTNYDKSSLRKTTGLIIFRKNFFFKKNVFNLDIIVIDKKYKRKGLGSEMISNMIKDIRENFNNFQTIFIYLKTLKFNNQIGNKFYKNNKFIFLYSKNKYNIYYMKLNMIINSSLR